MIAKVFATTPYRGLSLSRQALRVFEAAGPNPSMKPIAPWRSNLREIAINPAPAYLFLVRPLVRSFPPPTIGEILRDSGYATSWFGKDHSVADAVRRPKGG